MSLSAVKFGPGNIYISFQRQAFCIAAETDTGSALFD